MPSKSKKGKGKAHSAKAKKEKVDIMSPAAMYNLYYISHNAPDSLIFRGFSWSGGQRKKGRK
ncbi:small lysine-rich protein 1 [Hemiscyllium ocellatum]|uniref:small lysine-rich protein 1 n=1 Tax=Hemiscyllium ocellatum TaxID=170820 RepID=UPI0029673876|nr:small lysine-rich protein 1 [Hemiscyllium ocellatum]